MRNVLLAVVTGLSAPVAAACVTGQVDDYPAVVDTTPLQSAPAKSVTPEYCRGTLALYTSVQATRLSLFRTQPAASASLGLLGSPFLDGKKNHYGNAVTGTLYGGRCSASWGFSSDASHSCEAVVSAYALIGHFDLGVGQTWRRRQASPHVSLTMLAFFFHLEARFGIGPRRFSSVSVGTGFGLPVTQW